MKSIRPEKIREISEQALNREFNVRKNNCDNISNNIGYILEEEYNIPAYTVKAPINGAKHFVCVIPSEFVVNYDDYSFIVIDATIKQFSENYPDIVISSSQNVNYYDYINKPTYTLKEKSNKNQKQIDNY